MHTIAVAGVFVLSICQSRDAVAQTADPGPDRVRITVTERAGVDRRNELVRFGVPLPQSWNVSAPADLRLERDDGSSVPTQFEATARWGAPAHDETAPIKWLLVSYLESVAANDQTTVVLTRQTVPVAAVDGIEIGRGNARRLTVNTGAAEFVINTDDTFNLLEQVLIDGTELLTPLSADRAIDYAPLDGVSIVPGGRPDLTPRTTSVEIERSGPLEAVVRLMGSIRDDDGNAVLDFTARLYFAAESSAVRVDLTVENNHPIELGEYEQPTNAHDTAGRTTETCRSTTKASGSGRPGR